MSTSCDAPYLYSDRHLSFPVSMSGLLLTELPKKVMNPGKRAPMAVNA